MGPSDALHRGDGCRDDGGPLWIRVPVGEELGENVWASVFQKNIAAASSSHTNRYTQLAASESSYPSTPAASSLAECFAVFICTTE
jgi:hypothetical protein